MLGHPGDEDMKRIAEDVWEALDPLIPVGDSTGGEGSGEGGSDEGDAEEEQPAVGTVLKGYYFENSTERFSPGGSTGMRQEMGALVLTAAADGQPRAWTCANNGPYLNVSAADATNVRIMMKTEVTDPTFGLYVDLWDGANADTTKTIFYSVDVTLEEEGYTEIMIDLTAPAPASADWDETLTMKRMGIYALGFDYGNTSQAGKVVYMDSIEVLHIDPVAEEPPKEDTPAENVLKGYYFKNNTEGFSLGGSTRLNWADGAIVITAAADGRPRVWTAGNDANAELLNISAADAGYVRLMAKSEVTDRSFAIVVEVVDTAGTIKSVTYNVTPEWAETGYTEILFDLKASDKWNNTWTLNRICISPFGTVDNASLAGKVVYIDELEVLKENSTE